MNDKDKEAYAIYENTISHREGYLYIAREAWQAAVEYKEDEFVNRLAKAYMEGMKTGRLSRQAENKKLREALEFYAEYKNDDPDDDYNYDAARETLKETKEN